MNSLFMHLKDYYTKKQIAKLFTAFVYFFHLNIPAQYSFVDNVKVFNWYKRHHPLNLSDVVNRKSFVHFVVLRCPRFYTEVELNYFGRVIEK